MGQGVWQMNLTPVGNTGYMTDNQGNFYTPDGNPADEETAAQLAAPSGGMDAGSAF
jgi:hypothetical protein